MSSHYWLVCDGCEVKAEATHGVNIEGDLELLGAFIVWHSGHDIRIVNDETEPEVLIEYKLQNLWWKDLA